jgi:subtilase family protein
MSICALLGSTSTVPEHCPDVEADMPTLYSADTLTLGAADPADVGRLNDVLHSAQLGRPLGEAVRRAGSRLVVPVTGAEPGAVREALLTAAAETDVQLDPLYLNGTFQLDGKAIGHAFAWAELTVGDDRPAPAWDPMPSGLRRPVIALLDSGVRDHPWLPAAPADDPFVVHSDDPSLADPWVSPVADGSATLTPAGNKPGDVLEAGHGTFIAGLLRMGAPAARVLDLRVMTDDGLVRESTVISALHWLVRYRQQGNPVDVVCMAFGRPAGDLGEPDTLEDIHEPLAQLAAAGTQLVASAGNDHQGSRIYPAAFDEVTGVGAGFGEYHARFSNYGSWVDRYRDGVNVLSIMPPDRWARWSGTSFSAANFAADLARPHVL